MSKESFKAIATAIFIVTFIAVFLYFNVGIFATCDGTIVRGLFWLECIN